MAELDAEAARLRALRDLRVLDTPAEERFDRVVRLAQRLFDVPAVAINLIDRDRQWNKSNVGLEGATCAREDAVCSRTIAQPGALVVEDLAQDPRFSGIPAVTNDGFHFYAGFPLTAPGGERVGALCILDHQTRDLSAADLKMLRDLADLVEGELAASAELGRAGEVQRQLLPQHPPRIPGYQVAGRCLPANEVGGDFFDWTVMPDDDLQLTLADVMGKGIPAAIIAASVRAMLRGASHYNPLPQAVDRAARALENDLTRTGSFVTMFTCRIEPATGKITYVDAGHGLTAIVGADGSHRMLVSHDLPLGVEASGAWSAHTDRLAPGETLISVSDGMLDLVPDLASAVSRGIDACAAAPTAQELLDRMTSFTHTTPTDDVTAIVVRRDDA